MWIIQPLEIKKNDAPSGKFRLTATSDEDGGGPYGLCDHDHDSMEDAVKCPDAAERSRPYGGWIKTQADETRVDQLIAALERLLAFSEHGFSPVEKREAEQQAREALRLPNV